MDENRTPTTMKAPEYCPECSIGLNNSEIQMKFCQNCRHDWNDEEYEDDEDNFNHCCDCDLPDACSDFGCAIEQGIKRKPEF